MIKISFHLTQILQLQNQGFRSGLLRAIPASYLSPTVNFYCPPPPQPHPLSNQIPRCPRNMPNSSTLNYLDPLKGCKKYHNEIIVNFPQELFKEYSDCIHYLSHHTNVPRNVYDSASRVFAHNIKRPLIY